MADQQSTEDRDRRRRLLLVIVAALALLVVILILIITQCGGDDGEQVAQIDTPSTAAIPSPTAAATAAPSPTPTPAPTAAPSPAPALSACEAVPALPTAFTDQANLYSISLPDGWAVVDEEGPLGGRVSRIVVESPDFSVFVDEAAEGPFTPIYYETGAVFIVFATNGAQDPPYHAGFVVISESNVTIDGNTAPYHVFKEPSTFAGQILDAHVNHGGNHYNFSLGYNPETCPAGEGLFQAMLDSFQFN